MSTLPSLTPERLDADRLLAPTWVHAVHFWWALTWRSVLWAVLVGLALYVPTFVLALVGAYVANLSEFVVTVMGYVIAGLVQIFVLRELLDKDFRKFRICIVSKP